jgi:hypothetical protein
LIGGNSNLSSLHGLENITSLGGDLSIGFYTGTTTIGNPALSNLTGLENLVSIDSSFEIQFNQSLNSLEELESLTSIGGSLNVSDNTSLHSLAGLDNLNGGTIKNLYIRENDSLSTCEVECICNYLVRPNGISEVHDNAPGCNTEEEVEAACSVGLNEHKQTENLFTISPNPSSTLITIKTSAISPKFQISIFNFQGQEVIKQQFTNPITFLNISALPAGVYFVRMTGERTVSVEKFVKID